MASSPFQEVDDGRLDAMEGRTEVLKPEPERGGRTREKDEVSERRWSSGGDLCSDSFQEGEVGCR